MQGKSHPGPGIHLLRDSNMLLVVLYEPSNKGAPSFEKMPSFFDKV